MPNLLFLSHRIPYPPDKGEKIRALNLVKHLAQNYRVHLGCLMENPEDPDHLHTLGQWCTEVAGFHIDKRRQKLGALARFRTGRPLMLDYYRNAKLRRWVKNQVDSTQFDLIYVFSVAMMPYVEDLVNSTVILDAQDIDSEKWTTYAESTSFPMRMVWAREGRTLLAYERGCAMAAAATLFVSAQEADRFEHLAPETQGRVHAVENGVDLDCFSPALEFPNPYSGRGPHLAFTGNMDYWPNADAVIWFVAEVLPVLRATLPDLEFHVVGANPGPRIACLNSVAGVQITGRVADIRPYTAHANACVAPLRIARGIQNKVLEAMAMGKPVIASPQAYEGVRAIPGRDLLVAEGADATALAILEVLRGRHPNMGNGAREAMERVYSWPATLSHLDAIIATVPRTSHGSRR